MSSIHQQLLLCSVLVLGAPLAHAGGWMDLLSQAAQVAAEIKKTTPTAQPNTLSSAAAAPNAPAALAPSELRYMDCAELELAALNTKRGIEDIQAYLKDTDEQVQSDSYKQQQSSAQTMGLIGNLMSLSKSQKAQNVGQSLSAMDPTAQMAEQNQQQMALAKKYVADRDAIAIYQKHRGCTR